MTDLLKDQPDFLPDEMAKAEILRATYLAVTAIDIFRRLIAEYGMFPDDVWEHTSGDVSGHLIGQMEHNCIVEMLDEIYSAVNSTMEKVTDS